MIVLIKNINLSTRDNFLFKSTKKYLVILFAIVVNSLFYAILARNDLD